MQVALVGQHLPAVGQGHGAAVEAIQPRSGEIKAGHDRWANLEVNYLLQRIEEFSGVVILATNFRQNIDDAFQRRIHVVVEFPSPDAASRRELMELHGDAVEIDI